MLNMQRIQDNCEAFDTAIAMFYWLSHWHEGQTCEKYAAMSSLIANHNLQVREDLDESTQPIYDELNETNWQTRYSELIRYLNDEWNKE